MMAVQIMSSYVRAVLPKHPQITSAKIASGTLSFVLRVWWNGMQVILCIAYRFVISVLSHRTIWPNSSVIEMEQRVLGTLQSLCVGPYSPNRS